jgi:hypothetical protein
MNMSENQPLIWSDMVFLQPPSDPLAQSSSHANFVSSGPGFYQNPNGSKTWQEDPQIEIRPSEVLPATLSSQHSYKYSGSPPDYSTVAPTPSAENLARIERELNDLRQKMKSKLDDLQSELAAMRR